MTQPVGPLRSLSMAAVQMLVGDGSGEGREEGRLFLSGAKDYGQDHKSCSTVLIRPSSFAFLCLHSWEEIPFKTVGEIRGVWEGAEMFSQSNMYSSLCHPVYWIVTIYPRTLANRGERSSFGERR